MANEKILIVDDEEETLQALDKKLSAEGYQVIKASRAREAIDKTRRDMPDLILMDIVLPDMEGSAAVKELSNDPQTRNIPTIFLSGIVTKEADEEVLPEVRVGDRIYKAIAKPFSFEELMDAVKKAIH